MIHLHINNLCLLFRGRHKTVAAKMDTMRKMMTNGDGAVVRWCWWCGVAVETTFTIIRADGGEENSRGTREEQQKNVYYIALISIIKRKR